MTAPRDLTTEAAERLRVCAHTLIDLAHTPQPPEATETALAQFEDALSNFFEQVRSAASSQSASSAVAFQRINTEQFEDHERRITALEAFQKLKTDEQRAALLSELGSVTTLEQKLATHLDYVSNMVHSAMIQPLEFRRVAADLEKLQMSVHDLCEKLSAATGTPGNCGADG